MIINVYRDPYDSGFTPTKPKQIEINPGVTVLVGCNGAGKTTLLRNIGDECRVNNIPVHKFDNLSSGGNHSIGSLLCGIKDTDIDDYNLGALLFTSSEGESIRINLIRQSRLYNEFMKSGYYKDKTYRISAAFNKNDEPVESNKRVLLYDATDSGLSIDNICDIKILFKNIQDLADSMEKELYIIITANEYELCDGENCFDVNKGKYITFSSYDDYKTFILHSRDQKEKRLIQQEKWRECKKEEELQKYKALQQDCVSKINAIKDKAKQEDKLSYSNRRKIEFIKDKYYHFCRSVRFIEVDSEYLKNM